MKHVVYISGKIGELKLSQETIQKFQRAEYFLKSKGYETFNPTDGRWIQKNERSYGRHLAENWDFSEGFYGYILSRDIRMLSKCWGIYMLPDYEKSPGALAELAF